MSPRSTMIIAALVSALAACRTTVEVPLYCDPSASDTCPIGSACTPAGGGAYVCKKAVAVALKGSVTELGTGTAIEGARVVALDENRAPVSAVATSDASGNYELTVYAVGDDSGVPQTSKVTLRADAQGYQSFPGGVRAALPIDLASATLVSDSYEISGSLANIGLIALPSTADLGIVKGTAEVPELRVGVLVVAEPTGTTAIADSDGSYVLFNLPASASPGTSYTVTAYGKGVNYSSETVSVTPNGDLTLAPVADLSVLGGATATVDGSLIFNSGARTPTSVALVVKSTYVAALDRGESPPGLVAQVPSGNGYTFEGVPSGTYIVLGGFGIDGDVRDVSGVGNTAPVEIVVSGASVSVGQFKLCGAIDLTHIDGVAIGTDGRPTSVTSGTPVFEWANGPTYSNAQTFEIVVYDSFGSAVWTHTQAKNGGGPYTATYAGSALDPGMYYQLRIRALDGSGIEMSKTEDLQGVFYKP